MLPKCLPARVLRSMGDAGCVGDLGEPTLGGAGPLLDFRTGPKFSLELVPSSCSSGKLSTLLSAASEDPAALETDCGLEGNGDCGGLLAELGLSAWP